MCGCVPHKFRSSETNTTVPFHNPEALKADCTRHWGTAWPPPHDRPTSSPWLEHSLSLSRTLSQYLKMLHVLSCLRFHELIQAQREILGGTVGTSTRPRYDFVFSTHTQPGTPNGPQWDSKTQLQLSLCLCSGLTTFLHLGCGEITQIKRRGEGGVGESVYGGGGGFTPVCSPGPGWESVQKIPHITLIKNTQWIFFNFHR